MWEGCRCVSGGGSSASVERHRQAAAIRARSRLSMEASPYAHVAAGHDISRPFTMKTPPAGRVAPRTPALTPPAYPQQCIYATSFGTSLSCKELDKTTHWNSQSSACDIERRRRRCATRRRRRTVDRYRCGSHSLCYRREYYSLFSKFSIQW